MDMPDMWIGFNEYDRLRYWWRTGMGTLLLVGVVVAMILTTHEPGKWWWVGVLGLLPLIFFVTMVHLIYGRVLLTARGLQFRTFVSRRVVPWSEVTGIERRLRVTRSGFWGDLRVVRVRGRSLTVPGTVTNRRKDAELDRKQAVVQEYWARAVKG
ncbi:hypothetical protein [Streptomyces sp. NPDC001274]